MNNITVDTHSELICEDTAVHPVVNPSSSDFYFFSWDDHEVLSHIVIIVSGVLGGLFLNILKRLMAYSLS